MTIIFHALEATGRSLKLAPTKLAVRLGARLAPRRTAEFIANRFFTTDKPPAARTAYS